MRFCENRVMTKLLFKLANYIGKAAIPSSSLRWHLFLRKCNFNSLNSVLRFGILKADGVMVDSPPIHDVVACRFLRRVCHSSFAVPVSKKVVGDVGGLSVSQGAAGVLLACLLGFLIPSSK